uniref:Secreted protein n=1 Tax=Trypanosoma vivax (strain Y486) TaxID=1055687 RepID=G0TRJ9_TRYVY|nr:hypothetical protein, unlikely [Trypanosoma vivax Y486]
MGKKMWLVRGVCLFVSMCTEVLRRMATRNERAWKKHVCTSWMPCFRLAENCQRCIAFASSSQCSRASGRSGFLSCSHRQKRSVTTCTHTSLADTSNSVGGAAEEVPLALYPVGVVLLFVKLTHTIA